MHFFTGSAAPHAPDTLLGRSPFLWQTAPGSNEYVIKRAIPGLLGKFVSTTEFKRIRDEYESKWPAVLALFTSSGRRVMGKTAFGVDAEIFAAKFRPLLDESLRRGEPWVEDFDAHSFVWVAPILVNTRLVGGMVGSVDKGRVRKIASGERMLRSAAADLLRVMEDHDLTNAPFMDLLRRRALRQSSAQPVYAFKFRSADFRSIYIKEEPALLSAIRKGAREEAREALNRILVVLVSQANDDLSLLKSFFLELVILMCRAAVEAGCEASVILGANYERFTELSEIRSDETLSPWLHNTLERLIDAIHRHQDRTPSMFLRAALKYMHDHISEDISRDSTAAAVGMSNAHFSRQFKLGTGVSFTDALNRMRVDHAAELLARTDRRLYMISMDSGFRDQSYFTKVFKKHLNKTPREYRMELLAARKSET